MSTLLTLARRILPKEGADFRSMGMFLATLLFFFVSGACGLLYQVVWTRKLVLLFGTTSYAVSTVLSIFFLGLGLGSLWGGRLADRTKKPLALYGVFEIIIGLWALAFILSIDHTEAAVVAALRAFASTRAVAVGLRGVLALGFLLVPVTLMGATLPLLAKFVSASNRTRGMRIGALYSINTFGAVAGCMMTGFALLALYGYTRTTLIGAAANIVAGALAIVLSRAAGDLSTTAEAEASPEGDAGVSPRVVTLVVLGFAVSGFCALALEVLWTRLLVLVFLGTTYAFTTMLAAILCGIAAGSAVASAGVDRHKNPFSAFAMVEIFIGLSCLYMLASFAGLPERFNEMRTGAGFDWVKIQRGKFLLSFGVLFVPTFLFGMTFPFVVRAVTLARARLGRDIGRLYSANTFGGVLGSLAGGFVLMPLLGTHTGIVVISLMLFGVGMVLLLAAPGRGKGFKGAAAAASLVLLGVVWQTMPEDVGYAMNRSYLQESDEILHYREGVEGTVVVAQSTDAAGSSDRYLWINGMQATASIEKGVRMNRLQGALPLLFDREPREVLFMCFGSGITAGTLGLSEEFERIDAVELSEDVLEAGPFFKRDNLGVLDNPKVNFIVDDGRNVLLTTRKKYDVITFEPMPMAQAGVSTFYTKEYYEHCLDHLTPGGLVSQWVPLHSLDAGIVRSLTRTFTSVFPEYCAWFVNADVFLIGSNEPLAIDYAAVERRVNRPGVQEALRAVGFHDVAELLTCFFMGKEHVDAFSAEGTIMTDDRPWAEFVAPKVMYEKNVDQSLRELIPFYESCLPLVRFDGMAAEAADKARAALDRRFRARQKGLEGLVKYYGGFGSEPEPDFMAALDIDPADASARYYLRQRTYQRAGLYLRWEQYDEGIERLTKVLTYLPEETGLMLILADLYFAAERPEEALAQYERYVASGGKDARAGQRIVEIRGE